MKTINFAFAAGCILALAATNSTVAQNISLASMHSAKQQAISLDNSSKMSNADGNAKVEINTRAKKQFTKEFSGVINENWAKSGDGYTAAFRTDNKRTTVYYDRKGNWQGTLSGYTEDKLLAEVKDIVMHEFRNYTITYVDEILTTQSEGVTTYVVHLENARSIKLIRYKDGEMNVWEEYSKQ
ncbi:MAG: PepSY-like domain-containing protein, partial [Ferruginibacter sp.]